MRILHYKYRQYTRVCLHTSVNVLLSSTIKYNLKYVYKFAQTNIHDSVERLKIEIPQAETARYKVVNIHTKHNTIPLYNHSDKKIEG